MKLPKHAGWAGSRPLARRKPFAWRKPWWAGFVLAHIMHMAPVPGVWALQILDATDHAELTAEISSSEVNRIALDGDRVSRVIQSPSVLTVEHDPVRGDVYLQADRSVRAGAEPVTLYLGSEGGFTYRLTLRAAERGSAQLLIRNAAVGVPGATQAFGSNAEGRIGELVALIRAVARGEGLAGYEIVAEPGIASRGPAGRESSEPTLIETWRGLRWTARVLAHGGNAANDAAALAEAYGSGVVAAWVSPPGPGANDGRLAVTVEPSPGAGR